MNNTLAKKLKLIFILLPILLLTSCALRPISSDYNFIETNLGKIELDKLGDGKILIYNGADILHKIDNTGRLNIWIGNKALGQIRPREYVVINLKSGKYEFKALHIDVVNMRSTHNLEIDENTKVIRIEPTITSNKLTLTNKLPKKFDKFKYAKSR